MARVSAMYLYDYNFFFSTVAALLSFSLLFSNILIFDERRIKIRAIVRNIVWKNGVDFFTRVSKRMKINRIACFPLSLFFSWKKISIPDKLKFLVEKYFDNISKLFEREIKFIFNVRCISFIGREGAVN